MPDWTDLKLAMASCWKVVWKVDPLPLSVPESAALLDEGLLPPDGELLLDEELQAAIDKAAARATPAVAPAWMRTRCIFRYPSIVPC
jgi:hypothetical protein